MSIYIITKRDIILTVTEAWDSVYKNEIWKDDPEKQEISKKLNSLDLNTCSEKEIENIIGHDSWAKLKARLKCDECEKNVEKVIHVGDDEEFYGPVVLLCKDCLDKVNKVFEGD